MARAAAVDISNRDMAFLLVVGIDDPEKFVKLNVKRAKARTIILSS
jgi:hypothetical protein